jgi:hypothetical protein
MTTLDPTLSADDLRKLSMMGKSFDVMLHPNCPPSLFFSYAKLYPLLVESTPAGPLLLLEDGGSVWLNIKENKADAWLNTHLDSAILFVPEIEVSRYMILCWSHIKEAYKQAYPHDLALPPLIEAYQSFLGGTLSEESLQQLISPYGVESYPDAVHARSKRYILDLLSLPLPATEEIKDRLKDLANVMWKISFDRNGDRGGFLQMRIWQWDQLYPLLMKWIRDKLYFYQKQFVAAQMM